MLKKLLLGLSLLLAAEQTAQAQRRTCGTMSHLDRLEQQQPGTKAQLKALDRKIALMAQNPGQRSAAPIITIPVVVHVIYANASQNVSQAQIQSQIDALNEDYSKLNPDTTNIPLAFRSVAGNMQVRFELARRDPNDDPTTGVTRTATTHGAFSDDDAVKYTNRGGHDIWNRDKYLNLWVCDLGSLLLGYAQFPGSGPAAADGVVINYTCFGRIGTAATPYNKGRTATHEVGHWLDLYHIWGDEPACADDDLVTDTPLQKGENYNCPTFPLISGTGASCSGAAPGAMFMNYMDYVDDACMMMFTNGQKSRVHNALNAARDSLFTSNGLTPVVLQPLDASAFNITGIKVYSCVTQITPSVVLKNKGTTALTSATITYRLDSGAPQTYQWTGNLASLATTVITLPSISLAAGNHTFSATSSLPNGQTDNNTGNDAKNFSFVTAVPAQGIALPFSESFEGTFPPANWTLLNPDNDITWARTSRAAKAGSRSIYMNNYDYSFIGEVDELVMPALDLTTMVSPALTFQLAYARFSSSASDSLEIMASTDCGVTYSSLYKKGGSALATIPAFRSNSYTPAATDWRLESVPLTSVASGNSVILKFKHTTGYENNLYVDDVQVSGLLGMRSDISGAGFKLYPNPTNGQVKLELGTSVAGSADILVSNALGQEILRKTVRASDGKTIVLDLNGNAAGLYLIKVITPDVAFGQKVMLTK
jgi:hypothetical protein